MDDYYAYWGFFRFISVWFIFFSFISFIPVFFVKNPEDYKFNCLNDGLKLSIGYIAIVVVIALCAPSLSLFTLAHCMEMVCLTLSPLSITYLAFFIIQKRINLLIQWKDGEKQRMIIRCFYFIPCSIQTISALKNP